MIEPVGAFGVSRVIVSFPVARDAIFACIAVGGFFGEHWYGVLVVCMELFLFAEVPVGRLSVRHAEIGGVAIVEAVGAEGVFVV